jgi:hypothetical protein
MSDQPTIDLCACPQFRLWYHSDNHTLIWCVCGHEISEHLDGRGSCTGLTARYGPNPQDL